MRKQRIIRSKQQAEEALAHLAEYRFQQQLTLIRQTARSMAQARAGTFGRQQAVRAVLIGFADNVDTLELAS